MCNGVAEHESSRLQKLAGRCVTCLVALLALLALDDITTGVEPGFLAEWAMVAFAFAWFLAVGVRSLKWRQT